MYEKRIRRVLDAMAEMGLEQMIISDSDSIWYLTGYYVAPMERLFALCLRRSGRHTFFLNKLFPAPENDFEQVWFSDTDDYLAILASHVDSERPIGIDKEWPARFLLPLMEHNPRSRCVLASDCVDNARACKDAAEQELMREASRINDAVMERVAAFIKEGMTEREVAEFIVGEFAAAGCDGVSFEPIVSFAANAADPHHEPDDTVLREGERITISVERRRVQVK